VNLNFTQVLKSRASFLDCTICSACRLRACLFYVSISILRLRHYRSRPTLIHGHCARFTFIPTPLVSQSAFRPFNNSSAPPESHLRHCQARTPCIWAAICGTLTPATLSLHQVLDESTPCLPIPLQRLKSLFQAAVDEFEKKNRDRLDPTSNLQPAHHL